MKYAILFLLLTGFCLETQAFDVPENCPAKPLKKDSVLALASEWFEKGQQNVRAKKYDAAVDAYRCSLRMVEHPSTLLNAGNAALLAERYDVATEMAEMVLAEETDPRSKKDAEKILSAAQKATRDSKPDQNDPNATSPSSGKAKATSNQDAAADSRGKKTRRDKKAAAAAPAWKRSPLKFWGLRSLGVGAAVLVAGGITGGIALAKNSEVEDACKDRICYDDDYDLLDTRDNLATATTVLLISGGIIAATGIVLLLAINRKESKKRSVAWAIGPSGVVFQGAF